MRIALSLALTFIAATSAFGQPQNDFCADAIPVGLGGVDFDSTGAITDGPFEPTCGFCCGDEQLNHDVWFEHVADENGPLEISLCGSSFDTKLAVYEGACPVAPGELIACNDDDPACELNSKVRIDARRGRTYLIRIGGFRDLQGPGVLLIAPPPQPPIHDECQAAIVIETGETYRSTTVGATGEDVTSCTAGDTIDVWHDWTADCTGLATASLCNESDFDTSVAVFDRCNGAELACDDDGCERASRVDFEVTEGESYLVRVSGYSGLTGNYGLTMTCADGDMGACCEPDGSCSFGTQEQCDGRNGVYHPARPCENIVCAPPNDDCADATDIFDGVTDFTTLGASTDGPAHADCDFAQFDQIDFDIWYRYRSTVNGEVTVSLCNTADYDSKIAVYADVACPTNDDRLLGCNDDAEGCELTSELTFEAQCGREYLIRVGGFADSAGSGSITIVPEGDCVECDAIKKFKVACQRGKLKAKVKSSLAEGVILTIDNSGQEGFMRINNRGKGKVIFRGQSGPHDVSIVECPERRESVDCG